MSFNLLRGCDVDASIPGLRSVNKGDAKCNCAMRNVIFVSELIGFSDRKATNLHIRTDYREVRWHA